MQQDAPNERQLIVERIRQSTNILVAVSANPSVDALSAALGLALMLNKIDKHATAVFSGNMPPAMEFLEPGNTFEQNVDSLRDFIISLDKEKADRLRYKVEEDVVRIFITPYRTTITQNDLQFSQGDFNVDMILALGVDQRDDLDKAIIAHGRILHDATVMTVNANNQQSTLGTVDWHEPNASSLCEMMVSLAESLQQPGLLDAQISTALLTGIVAATDRFSNQHTTPKIMTMSAQLMAAGANQQLIANNLIKAHELPEPAAGAPKVAGGSSGNGSVKVDNQAQPPKQNGELDIPHEQPPKQSANNKQRSQRSNKKSFKKAAPSAEDELAAALPQAAATNSTSGLDQLKQAVQDNPTKQTDNNRLPTPPKQPGSESVNGPSEDDKPTPTDTEESYLVSKGSWRNKRLEPPALGGTLNATTEQAHKDARTSEEKDRNGTILTHSEDTNTPEQQPAVQSPEPQPPAEPQPTKQEDVQPAVEPPLPQQEPAPAMSAPEPPQPPMPEAEQPLPPSTPPQPEVVMPPQQDTSQQADQGVDAARQAVNDALAAQPFNPAGQPLQSVGSSPLGNNSGSEPPMPPPPPMPPADAFAPQGQAEQPAPQGLTALPPMPPLPQQEPAPAMPAPEPPQPPMPEAEQPLPSSTPPQPLAPPPIPPMPPEIQQGPPDPGQFQIPTAK